MSTFAVVDNETDIVVDIIESEETDADALPPRAGFGYIHDPERQAWVGAKWDGSEFVSGGADAEGADE